MSSMYKRVQNDIIKALADYMSMNIAHTNSSAERPPYPFLTYNITSPHLPHQVIDNFEKELVDSEEEGFDEDIEYASVTQPSLVLSINSHDTEDASTVETEGGNMIMEQDNGAYEKAKEVWDWFNLVGRDHLRQAGFTVVEAGNIEDRDVLHELNYERRKGFDVTLRYLDTVKITTETIESVEYRLNEEDEEINT